MSLLRGDRGVGFTGAGGAAGRDRRTEGAGARGGREAGDPPDEKGGHGQGLQDHRSLDRRRRRQPGGSARARARGRSGGARRGRAGIAERAHRVAQHRQPHRGIRRGRGPAPLGEGPTQARGGVRGRHDARGDRRTGGGARTSAVGLDPQVALVVDVTHATDYPGAEKKRAGEHKLGGGPVLARGSSVSPVVFELLVQCAEREQLPYSVQAAPHDTPTAADAIYNALRGIPTGLVSVPNRYMHSPNEMVALEDLERAARLLAAFARRLDPKVNFIPG